LADEDGEGASLETGTDRKGLVCGLMG
jgi:hypothetical protein